MPIRVTGSTARAFGETVSPDKLALRALEDWVGGQAMNTDELRHMLMNFYRAGQKSQASVSHSKLYVGVTIGWWACALCFWTIRALG